MLRSSWRCCWNTSSSRCRLISRSRLCPSWRPWRTCRRSSVRPGWLGLGDAGWDQACCGLSRSGCPLPSSGCEPPYLTQGLAALPEPRLHHDPVKPAEQPRWEASCGPLEHPVQGHHRGRSCPPTRGTRVGVGVAAPRGTACPLPSTMSAIVCCSVAAPEGQHMGLPACGRAVSGAGQAVPGCSARAVSQIQRDWRSLVGPQ